ncbi:MAG: type II toxin-antitoxin system VapC family toxin [Kiritimatiellae bacterium]|nr:type II toxin-antitoxin system VapC family toxin [Kiritimatiellia bacterium]
MLDSNRIKVYLESSFFGYLTGRPSAIPKTAFWQALTLQWWENHKPKVDCFVSRWVRVESEDGDPAAVARRRIALQGITELRPPAEEVASLAEKSVAAHALPSNEIIDAFHIATATVSKMNYLLTWNCKHLANYSALPKTYSVLTSAGYSCPVIITPEKYMEELNYE